MRLEMNVEKTRSGFHLHMDGQLEVKTLGLFGPSGVGKTTLLHLLAGLERPDTGRIVLDGQTLCDTRQGLFVPPHERRIGVVFQEGRLFPHLSVRRNLKFAQRLAPRSSRRLSFDTIVEILELGYLLGRRTPSLSGGESQRVALARALLAAPQILLLDEPVSALDGRREAQVLPLLKRLEREFDLPMILVSHRLSQIRYLTDDLAIMRDGRLQASGRFETLIEDPDVVRLMYGHDLLNVLRLRVVRQAYDDGMTLLEPCTPSPRVPCVRGPLVACAKGTPVVATVRPEDIIVSLAPAEHISARNQLRGVIKKIVRVNGRTLCYVDAGMSLLVDVTHSAVAELELSPGKKVWCLLKAHAVSYPYESHATSPGDYLRTLN